MNKHCFQLRQIGWAIFVVSLLAIYTADCAAQAGVLFLTVAPDARARGMGQGGSVYSTGAKSAFYNPANLVTSGILSADIIYCKLVPEYVDNVSYKSAYLSGSYKGKYFWGTGFNYLDLGEFTRYDESRGYISLSDYQEAFAIYCAANFGDGSGGIGIKYIRSRMADAGAGFVWDNRTASSYAIDLGYQIRNRFPQTTLVRDKTDSRDDNKPHDTGGMSFGVSILNIGPDLDYKIPDWYERLPRRLLLAGGYQMIDTRYYDLKLTLDASKILLEMNNGFKTEWDEIIWSYGLELKYYSYITLRAGAYNNRDYHQRYWSYGVGLGPDWLRVDYSYVSKSTEDWNSSGGEYALALTFNLNRPVAK